MLYKSWNNDNYWNRHGQGGIQVDGSCDSANLEEKLFMALYLNPYHSHGKGHVCNKFLFCSDSLLVPMLLFSLKLLEPLHMFKLQSV